MCMVSGPMWKLARLRSGLGRLARRMLISGYSSRVRAGHYAFGL